MKLYQISNQYNLLQQELDNFAQEGGIIQESWINQINAIEDEAKNKLINIGLLFKNMKAEKEKLETHQEEIKKKIKQLEERMDWLKYYAEHHMNEMGINNIKDTFVTLRIQKTPPRVECEDESVLDDGYFVVTKRVDKMKLKSDLQNGIEIKGAHLIQSERLVIA